MKNNLCYVFTLPLIVSAINTAVAAQQNQLEEVVVTAEKRETNLQETPLAITALSGDFLKSGGIEDFNDVSVQVPSLSFTSFSKTRVVPSIRGAVSSIISAGNEQSVGIFVDEVYMGSVTDFDPDLFDVERVEVLRGPQGTLFGRNVVGGALNIITKKPTQEFEARLGVTAGNFGALSLQGYVSGALSDNAAASFSVNRRKNDGLARNVTTSDDIDDTDKTSFRTRIAVDVSDTFELQAGLDHTIDKSSVGARKFLGPAPTAPTLFGWIPNSDPNDVYQSAEASQDMDNKFTGAWLKMTWAFENMDLVSISSYRSNDISRPYEDAVGTPVSLIGPSLDYDSKQYTQELRLVSTNEDSRFDWVAGLYYLDSEIDSRTLNQMTTIPGTIFHDFNSGSPGWDADTPRTSRNLVTANASVESIAAYGQITYEVADSLKVTLGGRYTRDKKAADFESLPGSNTGDPNDDIDFIFYEGDFAAGGSDSWSKFTPKLTIDYAPTGDILVYFSASKGFKSGGFQARDTVLATERGFDPEEAVNLELGFKSRFLDDRLQFNAAAFQTDYKDQQVTTTLGDTFVTITGNAGETEVKGLELELNAVPIDGLTLWLSATFLDAEYVTEEFFSDGDVAFAPDYAYSAGFSYATELASGGTAAFNMNLSVKDEFLLEPQAAGEEAPFLSGFDEQVNARLSYTSAEGDWEVSLWGKNITDERYVVYGQDLFPIVYGFGDLGTNPAAAASTQPRFNPPRTYGITFEKSF
ncbi:TonB-dependent receptor [Pseudomaricurvus alkylphenolicus]|uniref:TonB-dependent receptor n=1 Tax=Pseudomaricurvus alkylphenolicus TaxID=1306991 RepID=UPI001421EA67|nr:TonB-dependent receptor [Pseudomaricurvus alkylphenolicus]NIB39013.1 TonB-dependent receptor [Pseudomaricurvus alkylphenolicus]